MVDRGRRRRRGEGGVLYDLCKIPEELMGKGRELDSVKEC